MIKSQLRIVWVFLLCLLINAEAFSDNFRWGNGYYYDLAVGERILFQDVEVELLQIENHYNRLKIGKDTVWLKVARRSLPEKLQGIRVFVADNKTIKSHAGNPSSHALLTKDALICLSDLRYPLLDPGQFRFPVSFNHGFTWSMEEESTFLPYTSTDASDKGRDLFSPGIVIDLHDSRNLQKHWLIAMEKSQVVWIEKILQDDPGSDVALLLHSANTPEIYYLYSGIDPAHIQVRKGERLETGDLLGTVGESAGWRHLRFSVILAGEDPTPGSCNERVVNGFPQLYELCYPGSPRHNRSFSRGKFTFGLPLRMCGGKTGIHAYEPYAGRGWILGPWNPADRVERISNHKEGNVRLQKTLFRGTAAQCVNPNPYFDYRINVPNGFYRVRIRAGDLELPTSQRIEFNGIAAGTKTLEAGEFDWTGERVVQVVDGKLQVRIYPGTEDLRAAGLSEIVFQRAYRH